MAGACEPHTVVAQRSCECCLWFKQLLSEQLCSRLAAVCVGPIKPCAEGGSQSCTGGGVWVYCVLPGGRSIRGVQELAVLGVLHRHGIMPCVSLYAECTLLGLGCTYTGHWAIRKEGLWLAMVLGGCHNDVGM
jgi:hypothetical protein